MKTGKFFCLCIFIFALSTQAFAARLFFKGDAELVTDNKIKNNIDMNQMRILTTTGYSFSELFNPGIIIGVQNAKFDSFSFTYSGVSYSKPDYKFNLTYGIEINGCNIFTAGPVSFGYNARLINTKFKAINFISASELKQTVINAGITAKIDAGKSFFPFIYVGFLQDNIKCDLFTLSEKYKNDKAYNLSAGVNYKAADNIILGLTGSFTGEQAVKLSAVYLSNPVKEISRKTKNNIDEPKAKTRKLNDGTAVAQPQNSAAQWSCKNGHKYDKEMKYCIECGAPVQKVETKETVEESNAGSELELDLSENINDGKTYWVCKNNHKFDKELKFCIECGEVLEKVEPIIQKQAVIKYINVCPVCKSEFEDDAKFCTDDGAKLVKKRIIAKPQFKFVDDKGNLYLSENEIPRNVKAAKYPYSEKVLVGYQSLGTGKIYKEKLNFCPETGKPVVPLYK